MGCIGYFKINNDELVGIAATPTTLDGRYLHDSRKLEPLGREVIIGKRGNQDLAGKIINEMRGHFRDAQYQCMIDGLSQAAASRLGEFFEERILMPIYGLTFDQYIDIQEGELEVSESIKQDTKAKYDSFRQEIYGLFVAGIDGDSVSMCTVFPDGGKQEHELEYWWSGKHAKECIYKTGDILREDRIRVDEGVSYPIAARVIMEVLRKEAWMNKGIDKGTQLVYVRRDQKVEDVDWRRVALLHNILTFQGNGYIGPSERDNFFTDLLVERRPLEDVKTEIKKLAKITDGGFGSRELDEDRIILIN